MKAFFLWSDILKCFCIILSCLFVFPGTIHAQKVYVKFASGPHWYAFNGPGRLAGKGWMLPGFTDSAWAKAYNGMATVYGVTNGGCAGPNSSAWNSADTVIWTKSKCYSVDTACFRYVFTLPRCGCYDTAIFKVTVDDAFTVYLNGNRMGAGYRVNALYPLTGTQLATWLHPGENVMTVEAYNALPYCAGFASAASIRIDTSGCALRDTAICKGQKVLLNSGKFKGGFLWNTGDTTSTITADSAGTYQIRVISPTCNAFFETSVVTVKPIPTVNLGPDTTVCAPTTVFLYANYPGAVYLWNTHSTASSIGVNTSGLYWVNVNYNGCIKSDSVNVNIKPVPIVRLGSDTTICYPNHIHLNAQYPGATYLWSTHDTSSSINADSTGLYWVVDTLNKCTASGYIYITVNPIPTVNLGNDTVLCGTQTLILDAKNTGDTFLWSTGAITQTVTVNSSGTYWVQIDKNNCKARDTINVTVNPVPVVNLGNDTLLCQGQILVLNAGNTGSTYLWSTGATTQTIYPVASGLYWVEVDDNNCKTYDTIMVSIAPIPAKNFSADTVVCSRQGATLNAGNAGSTYLWSTGATTESVYVITSGLYWVEVDDNNCRARDTINIMFGQYPVVNIGPDQTICYNTTVKLAATNTDAQYVWSNGSTTPYIYVKDTGTYWVNVSNICGVRSDTVHISADPACDCYLAIPNAFTPNNDGTNDLYKPISNCPFGYYLFRIYDRWGEMVFETSNPTTGWNGTYKGQPALLATYVWYIQYSEHNQSTKLLKGNVTLLR